MRVIKKVSDLYSLQPVNRKISIVFIGSVLILFTIISISFAVQYFNIKHNQEEVPKLFFSTFNQYSLSSIADKTKNLMLAIVDYRMSLMAITRASLIKQFPQIPNSYYEQQSNHPQNPNILSCSLTTPTNSIFNCSWNMFTKYILQQSWEIQSRGLSRRLNLIYQNLQNPSDIMGKSISESPDFRITNITKINERFADLKQGYVHIASLYADQYGLSKQLLWAFRTKVDFPTYRILIQVQTFGSFIRDPISRVLYSDETNIVVLANNNSEVLKYSVVAKLKQLTPGLNYTNLLKLGYAESTLPNNDKIHSYTVSMSSVYKLGELSFKQSTQNNSDFVIIVHSNNIVKQLQTQTFNFIDNLHRSLNRILALFFVILVLLLVTNSIVLCAKIGRVLSGIIKMVREYSINPENYYQISNKMINMGLKDYIIRPIMRNLESVIRNIEVKKKKFKNKCKTRKMDEYPLSIFEQKFQDKHQLLDRQKFEQLQIKIMRKYKEPLKIIDEEA